MEINYTKFSEEQLNALRVHWGKLDKIGTEHLPKFHKIFDGCTDEALVQLSKANVKFVSKLAVNACVRRGIENKLR